MTDQSYPNVDDPLVPPRRSAVTAAEPGSAPAEPPVPPYYPNASSGPQFETRHLWDYVRTLYKRRWIAASAFVLVSISSALYTYTRVPVYRASVRILMQAQRQNYGFKDISGGDEGVMYFQTQYAILQSRSLAKKTMKALGTWQETVRKPASDESTVRQSVKSPDLGVVQNAWSFVAGLFGVLANTRQVQVPDADETAAETQQINGFLGGLVVLPVAGTGLVDLVYQSADPLIVARYANAHAAQFMEQNLEFKSILTKEASSWLSERLVEQRGQVEKSEQALQRYRETHGVMAIDERSNPLLQSLADMTTAVTRAKTDRIAKEVLYNRVRAVQNDRAALEAVPQVTASQGVQQARADVAAAQRRLGDLSERLGEKHPELIKARDAVKSAETRVSAEMTRALAAIQADFQAAEANETNLSRSLEIQRRQALTESRRGVDSNSGVELAVLTREVESNRQIYQNMMDRAKEVGLTEEIKTNNVRILDAAESPRAPVWPNTRKNMQYGFLGGLALAVGLAFFFEYLDNRIKAPDEIRTHLGLPFLGLVPTNVKGSATPLLNNGTPPTFGEAFRVIRTNVLFSSADDRSRRVLVTSAGPKEGKTVVSSNLAIALAQTGQRVLVIDADMRRPRLHDVFNVKREPGLSNLLVGDAKAGEVIRASNGLSVLPAGRTPPNPAELLGSKRFNDFLGRLEEHFDWIIIDSPPVLAVTDAAVIAHLVSGVLFVVSADVTNRNNARNAIEQLVSARGHFLGAVLNRVNLHRHGYYYSGYYKREYSEYYTSSKPAER